MALEVVENSADYTGMITEAEYQEYLRFDGSDQSEVINTFIESAIREAEAYCNASFGNKSFTVHYNQVTTGKALYLPFAPILNVTSVKRIKSDGTETELVLNSDYYLQGLKRKYITIVSQTESTNTYTTPSYLVSYSAGNITPSNTNAKIKEAILQIMSDNFENRDDIMVGSSVVKLGRTSMSKLAPYRNNVL